MAWISSTGAVGGGVNGVISTTANNALIIGDWSNDYLEIYGAGDTVLGNTGNDSICAVMYPSLGMNGTNVSIEGGAGDDMIAAFAVQGEQYATIICGAGTDSYGIGCNSDSTVNVVFEGFNFGTDADYFFGFYEGYRDKKFTCYSSDKGLIFRDDAGRLNVTLSGYHNYGELAETGMIYVYPRGIRLSSAAATAGTIFYGGEWKMLGDVINYGGYLSGLKVTGNAIIVNDYHSGGIVTNGIYGLDNITVIDNSQSHEARYLGGNSQDNYIFAGSGGDTLWGSAGNDVLVGGLGSDNFIYGAGEGSDVILDANWLDTVTLTDITSRNVGLLGDGNAVAVAMDANNSVVIQFNGIYSPLIKLADGATWRYKGDDGSWQNV